MVLLDLWADTGFRAAHIVFPSLTHLYHQLGGRGHCPQDRALRIHRDLQILTHLRIDATNAFWDPTVRRYVDIDHFQLFSAAVYTPPGAVRGAMPASGQGRAGSLTISSTLQAVARTKIFSTAVPLSTALTLTGQEAKLAFHLAKRFRFYEVYKRRVDDLCKVIPIEAVRADHRRQRLRAACQRLQQADCDLFRSWRFTKRRNTWLVEFIRAPAPTAPFHTAEMRALESVILEAGGDKKSLGYWRMCIRALGSNLIYRAVSEARLFCRETPGAHSPRVLTSRCESIAREVGAVINPRRRPKRA